MSTSIDRTKRKNHKKQEKYNKSNHTVTLTGVFLRRLVPLEMQHWLFQWHIVLLLDIQNKKRYNVPPKKKK